MPFLLVSFEEPIEPKDTDKNNNFPQPHQVPMFLIGGIGGLGTDWASVIEQLRLSGDNRPIYVYYDPRNVPDPKHPHVRDDISISDQVSLIVESMKEHLPPGGPAPYVIAGYSYGCGLAAEAAMKLHREGEETDLFLVDGATFEVSKKYFSTPSANLVRDLISIVRSIAKMASGCEIDFEVPNAKYAQLCNRPTIECMELIEHLIRTNIPKLNTNDNFNKLMVIAKNSINALLQYTPTPGIPDGVVDKIVLLTTEETVGKHTPPDKYLGWNKYTENLSIVDAEALRKQAHTDLLSGGYAEKLASLLKKFAVQETTAGKLFQRHLDLAMKAYTTLPNSSGNSKEPSPQSSPRTAARLVRSSGAELAVESFSDDDTSSDEEKRLDGDQIVKKLQSRIERIEEAKRLIAPSIEKRALRESGQFMLFGGSQQLAAQSQGAKQGKTQDQIEAHQNTAPTANATITVRA